MTSVGFLHALSSLSINISDLPYMPSHPFPQCLPDSITKEQLQPIHIQLPFNELIQDPTKLKFATTKLKDLEKHIQDAEERQKSPWFNGFSWYFYLSIPISLMFLWCLCCCCSAKCRKW